MTNFWDQAFGGQDYTYGTQPNEWLARQLGGTAPGTLFLPGEGEGRNALWAAQQGWQVHALDGSTVGRDKAQRLLAQHGLEMDYQVGNAVTDSYPGAPYDAVGIVFLHLPEGDRQAFHLRVAESLRPGGVVAFEYFHKRQLDYGSGGPPVEHMLYTAAMLRGEFPGVTWTVLEEGETTLDEGPRHQGRAYTVRGVGQKA